MLVGTERIRQSAVTPRHEVIVVHGVVQGVGFRPFVYRLAQKLDVKGDVCNSDGQVVINAVAASDVLSEFKHQLISQAPPHARPDQIECTRGSVGRYDSFRIIESIERSTNGSPAFAIPPDLATCPDCLAELFDRQNRRFHYPFINCTNCGPRYSIVTGSPYDRGRTTMRQFAMCPDCAREYNDPSDRRFHAEPIACAHCGPTLTLGDRDGRTITRVTEDVIGQACDAIRAGCVVAVKSIGGFHLVVDARNPDAVARLRERKAREAKPLALMYPSIDEVQGDCCVNEEEVRLLLSSAAPIVLLQRQATPCSPWRIADDIAPRNSLLGVMLPYSPLHHLIMRDLGFPIVATSGNRSEEPVCYENGESFSRLHGIADLFVTHDRPIQRFVDDSVVRVVAGRPLFLRRSRGYVPNPIVTPLSIPASLAMGGQQKCAVAIGIGNTVFLSRHIGDLDSSRSLTAVNDTIHDLSTQLRLSHEYIACDLHPDYHSTRIARQSGRPAHRVQHHYAHILSTMADNGINADVLGIAWDGTGYGDDGTIWGGEFLKADYTGFTRFAALRSFPLIGGKKAIHEPRRIAIGLLHQCFGTDLWNREPLAPIRATSETERRVFDRMLSAAVNSPMTSSMGRLFDGVASLLGIRQAAQFEGQAAMELEYAVSGCGRLEPYPFTTEATDCIRIDWRPLIRSILVDLDNRVSVGVIASRFHSTLAEIALRIARLAAFHDVILGGGCFQNRILLEQTIARLQSGGFEVWWPKQLPPNDGGLSLGQIVSLSQLRKVGR